MIPGQEIEIDILKPEGISVLEDGKRRIDQRAYIKQEENVICPVQRRGCLPYRVLLSHETALDNSGSEGCSIRVITTLSMVV